MKKKYFNLIKNILGAGKKRMQKFYKVLYYLSLEGMNFGNSGDFKTNGEIYVLKYINSKLISKSPLIIFDVGANVGNYSKVLSDYFGKNALIHSFEPSFKTFEQFLKNISGIPNIIANNIGFGESECRLTLYSNGEISVLASLYQRNLDQYKISMNITEEINISTIDIYCDNNNINHIHFLKLDIEGHELKALEGAKNMLKTKTIDFIQFEFGGCNIDSNSYFRDFYLLFKDNYHIYRILKDGLIEIKNYQETQEIFVTVNYLAEKKCK